MSESRQNIILVSVDSLRADHCGFLGDDRGLTPAMDRLADEGVAFETAVAPGPQTFSSMPAVFTGRPRPLETLDEYPGATHWERRLAAIDDHLDRYAPLPARLKELGYSTAGFSPNPWTSRASGFDRGFDRFEDFSGTQSEGRLHRLVDRLPGLDTGSKPVELALNMATGSSFFSRWGSFYEEVDAVREELSEPYFLWVFLLDTHYPFLPPRSDRNEQSLVGMYASAVRSEKAMRGNAETMPAKVRQSLRQSYRDTVRSVDSFIERLQADSADDDPALFVHADHGESFGEHGNYGHHHRQLYRENIHVPYLVHNAGSDETVSKPTSLSTIPTTALAVARGDPVNSRAVTARSAVATSECGGNRAVRERRFKYIDTSEEEALFDIETDPRERTDVSDRHQAPYRRTRARLDEFAAHCDELDRLSQVARAIAPALDL